jgi:drug/metabolite transporter superfamily protein YnfA
MGALKRLTAKLGIFGELLLFLWKRKLWWMIPMIIVLVLFGLLLILTQGSAIAPFIYTLF